jgi:hypothetical protein
MVTSGIVSDEEYPIKIRKHLLGTNKGNCLINILDGNDGQERSKDFPGQQISTLPTEGMGEDRLAHQAVVEWHILDNRRRHILL